MKSNIIKSILLIFSFVALSCSNDDSPNEFTLENIEISPKLENLSFEKQIEIGYDNKSQLKELLNDYINILFQKQDANDEKLIGFEIVISESRTIIKPLNSLSIPENSRLSAFASCPDGWENLGVCYSQSCVEGKVKNYFAEAADEFSSGSSVSFRLINHMGGKRVCAKTSAQ